MPHAYSCLTALLSARGGEGRDGGWGESEGASDCGDKSMLLCTQEVLSTNAFFAARQLDAFPSCSGGSPMASAPPAAESGGGRSACSPLPMAGAGNDSKWGPASRSRVFCSGLLVDLVSRFVRWETLWLAVCHRLFGADHCRFL